MRDLKIKRILIAGLGLTVAACSPAKNSISGFADPRVQNLHQELIVVDPNATSSSVSAQALVNIGSIYLESQMTPAIVTGTQLQASDIQVNGSDAYVSYSSVDTGGVIIKKGAVEHVRPVLCDNPLTLGLIEYCLQSQTILQLPNSDIFASYSDGSNLYAVGSTLDESAAPNYGRLYKINFDASKNPSSVAATVVLPSYAGTGVVVKGSYVLATSGTSTDPTIMGGLSIFNLADLSLVKTWPIFDARDVAINAADANSVYVTRAKVDASTPSAIIKYNADGTGTAGAPMAIGGNTIAESKSTLVVGSSLILASAGDGGFKILCKANGNVLNTVPAITVPGIDPLKSVTNSVAAVPGFLFAANGEAGVYVYKFQKSSALNATYCDGVTLTPLGRLSLASSTTYVNAELSANSIYAMTFIDVVNLVTNRMLVIASGNKGTSLLNVTNLNIGALDVNDF